LNEPSAIWREDRPTRVLHSRRGSRPQRNRAFGTDRIRPSSRESHIECPYTPQSILRHLHISCGSEQATSGSHPAHDSLLWRSLAEMPLRSFVQSADWHRLHVRLPPTSRRLKGPAAPLTSCKHYLAPGKGSRLPSHAHRRRGMSKRTGTSTASWRSALFVS